MSEIFPFACIVLATGLSLVLGCGSKRVDPRSIVADDVLANISSEDTARQVKDLATMASLIEVLLIEDKYLFRLPASEPHQDTVEAIKAFQRDKSFPITGKIDKAQFDLLGKGLPGLMGDFNLIGPPRFTVFDPLPGRRRATITYGTWSSALPTIEDPAGWPNTAEIECHEETGRCIEADASIIAVQSVGASLKASVREWRIREWTGSRMIASKFEDSTCPKLEVDWDAKTARSFSCPDAEGKRETSELISGFLPYFNFLNAEREARASVWNPAYTRLSREAFKGW